MGQVPIAYSARSGGRPENPDDHYTSKYLDLPNSPQFPFGHGLAYTRFAVGDPRVTVGREDRASRPRSPTPAPRAGATTLFLFIRDPVASVARPVLELRRFAQRRPRRRREPERSASCSSRDDLAFLDAALGPVVEPGRFEVHVGLSADPSGLRSASFVLWS